MLRTQMLKIPNLRMKPIISSMGTTIRNLATKTSKPNRQKIKWTGEQTEILRAISDSKSVFITGSAGTGKTMLLKQIIKLLRGIHGPQAVYVTASTGVAACALNGQTLHSFAGIGMATADRKALLSKILADKKALWRWVGAKALVIDEISMVDAGLFETLEYLARKLRDEGGKSWGGLQLVVSGDFFQLPPIIDHQNSSSEKEFAFEADCWDSSFDLQVELSTVFRQSDTQLVKMLQGIRRGECDAEDIQLLKQCCSDVEPEDSAVRLYPRNVDVNRVNEKRLSSLGEELVVYHALDTGADPWRRQLMQGITPTCLEICVGARVMLTKNISVKQKLVNGAVGTVTGFEKTDKTAIRKMSSNDGFGLLPIVKLDSGRERKPLVVEPDTWYVMDGEKYAARRIQIPLVLAWAMSIHKCQGMTLERLHTDLSKAFGYGMVYVALSRVRNLEGLHLSGFKPWKIKAHPKVLQFYESFVNTAGTKTLHGQSLDTAELETTL